MGVAYVDFGVGEVGGRVDGRIWRDKPIDMQTSRQTDRQCSILLPTLQTYNNSKTEESHESLKLLFSSQYGPGPRGYWAVFWAVFYCVCISGPVKHPTVLRTATH